MLRANCGSAPIWRQYSRNSSVPNVLYSGIPQELLRMLMRLSCGPMPSLQWYDEVKFPPKRTRGERISFDSLTASGSKPSWASAGPQREFVQFDALIPCELQNEIGRIKVVQLAFRNVEREGVFLPSTVCGLDLLRCENRILFPEAKRDEDSGISAEVPCVETAHVIGGCGE